MTTAEERQLDYAARTNAAVRALREERDALRARVLELELELATTRLTAGGPWCMMHGRTWASGCTACDLTRAELAR